MGKPYEMPDWKQWKVEDVPELLQTQKRLAKKGLKDPWLRNEVWRYQPIYRGGGVLKVVTKGFKWGLLAFVGAAAIEKIFFSNKENEHH